MLVHMKNVPADVRARGHVAVDEFYAQHPNPDADDVWAFVVRFAATELEHSKKSDW